MLGQLNALWAMLVYMLGATAQGIGWIALPVVAAAVLGMAGILPRDMRGMVGRGIARLGYLVMQGSGDTVAHIQGRDGSWHAPRPVKRGPNGGYIIEIGDKRLGFKPIGGKAASFLGAKVVTGYRGFGVLGDPASCAVARKAKEGLENGELERQMEQRGDAEVTIPSEGIVDLSDIRFLDKWNYEPDLVEKVETYTKASQAKFGGISQVQMYGFIIALVLGVMLFTWFISTNSAGGGGGGGMSLPFGLLMGVL